MAEHFEQFKEVLRERDEARAAAWICLRDNDPLSILIARWPWLSEVSETDAD